MTNSENNTMTENINIESVHAVADKEELVATFSKLSDEEKARFYEDCRNGITAKQSRENMLQFVRQLWQK